MRVILTGASGFVGANLCRRLLRDGHEVHCFLRDGYSPWRLRDVERAMIPHMIDLLDAESLNLLVGRIQPGWVFHLAAHGAYSWQTDVSRMVDINITGSANLLRACLHSGFEAFVHAGSSSEYGYRQTPPTEDDMPDPNSDYAVTKASGSLYCRYLGRKHHAPVYILRLYSVFGPYEEPGRLLPALILNGLRGALPPLTGPDTARDFIYVEDVLDAFTQVAECANLEPGSIFNVGSGVQLSLREVVETARQELGIAAQPQWDSMPARIWDTHLWQCDNRKLAGLGWRPKFSFCQGFRGMVEWFSSHAALRSVYEKKLGL